MLYGGTINLHHKEGIVPPFRLFRKQPLDLVASQIAELHQRSEAAADTSEPAGCPDPSSDPSLVAAGGWCAPTETIYGLLDLPKIGVRRGGFQHGGIVKGPRKQWLQDEFVLPAPDKSWIDMGPIND